MVFEDGGRHRHSRLWFGLIERGGRTPCRRVAFTLREQLDPLTCGSWERISYLFISGLSWPFGEDPLMVCSCAGGETWLQIGVVLLKQTGGDIGCRWRGSLGRHSNFLRGLLRPPRALFTDMKIDRVRKKAVKLISLADD